MERILELVTHKTIFPEICLQLYFLKESCHRLMTGLTSLEAKETPLACTVYNLLEDLRSYLRAGCTKTTFGTETDCLLAKLSEPERRKQIKLLTLGAHAQRGLQYLVCHSVCHSVSLSGHTILAVRAIKSIMKDTIVLSVRFAAILKWRFS